MAASTSSTVPVLRPAAEAAHAREAARGGGGTVALRAAEADASLSAALAGLLRLDETGEMGAEPQVPIIHTLRVPPSPEDIDTAWVATALASANILPPGHTVVLSRVEPIGLPGFVPDAFRICLEYAVAPGAAASAATPGASPPAVAAPTSPPTSVIARVLQLCTRGTLFESESASHVCFDYAERIRRHARVPRALLVAGDATASRFAFLFEDLNTSELRLLDRRAGINPEDLVAVAAMTGRLHAEFWVDDCDFASSSSAVDQDKAAAPSLACRLAPLPHWLQPTDLLPTRNVERIAKLFTAPVLRSLASFPKAWQVHAAAALKLAPFVQNYIASDVAPKTLLHHDFRGDNLLLVVPPKESSDAHRLAFLSWPFAGVGMPLLDLAWIVATAGDFDDGAAADQVDIHAYCVRTYWNAVAEMRGAEVLGSEYPFRDMLEDYHIALVWCFLAACQSVGADGEPPMLLRRTLRAIVELHAVQVATCRILNVLEVLPF